MDCGIDAVIVQDIGLIRLIRTVFPDLEIHGSTQMTVHDIAGAEAVRDLGVSRIVMARENTLDDLRAIHAAVPDVGVEAFVHGALCISYSGQCLMSGLISERSANRGACAQACRKDYVLRDATSGETIDAGYLISAKDLALHDDLGALADAGIVCLKVEGRKKRAEYVATVTRELPRVARPTRPWRASGAPSGRGGAAGPDLQSRIQHRATAWATGPRLHHARPSGQSRCAARNRRRSRGSRDRGACLARDSPR